MLPKLPTKNFALVDKQSAV